MSLAEHESYDAGYLDEAVAWGIPRLVAAAGDVVTSELVSEVVRAAWDLDRYLDARELEGYHEVVDLAIATNGWAWTDAVLIDTAARWAVFELRQRVSLAHAKREFGRLRADGCRAAVNDAFGRLIAVWPRVSDTDLRIPGWLVRPIMRQYLTWALLDAAAAHDAANLAWDEQPFVPMPDATESGQRGARPIYEMGLAVNDVEFEATYWHGASTYLAAQRSSIVDGARAGAVRTKADLTFRGAQRTLEHGAADADVRVTFDQDSLLCCFHSLGDVAPDTWGRYPRDKVPTRKVLSDVADDVIRMGLPSAVWFQPTEQRRKELNDKGRLLHGIKNLVCASLSKEMAEVRGQFD
jgi:hypothetical protein